MLMTDQVHLAAQLEAEFTLVPRSFSLSLYSLTFFFTHSLSLSLSISTPFSPVSLHVYVWERGEGEDKGAVMFLPSLSQVAVCFCVPVCLCVSELPLMACVYVCVCVYICLYARCERWCSGSRFWLKSSKRPRYKPGDLASLVEGQCAYGPFRLPHMETTWAVISEWPCQMGSHWKLHMLHH